MLPTTAFDCHEVSDLYKHAPAVDALLKERHQVSPEVFNIRIAQSVAHAMQPPKKTNSEYTFTLVTEQLERPIYNLNYLSECVESKDARLWKNSTLTLDKVALPQAVIERLGYKNVQTAADWIRNLPIAKRLIWNDKDPIPLTAKACTTLVSLTDEEETASVSFEVNGDEDDTWIYLSYSLDGENIGETVATYRYNGSHVIVKGRFNEQKECPYYHHAKELIEYQKNLSIVKPLQANCTEEEISQATYVTIAVKLNEHPPTSPKKRSSSKTRYPDTRFPVTFPTGTIPFPHAHGGKFTFDPHCNYISVTAAVGVNFSSKDNPELNHYYDSLCKRFEHARDAALTTLWGPSSEKIQAFMLKKLRLPASDEPKITLLNEAHTTRLDYTKSVADTRPSDGKVSVRTSRFSVTPPLPTQVPKQPGHWYENYPQIIRFATDDDVDLPPEKRLLAIFNYNPANQSYEKYTMTPSPTKISFEELK